MRLRCVCDVAVLIVKAYPGKVLENLVSFIVKKHYKKNYEAIPFSNSAN
jgi:hypothetical protein